MDIGQLLAQQLSRKAQGRSSYDGSSLVRSSRGSNYTLLTPAHHPPRHKLFRAIDDWSFVGTLDANTITAIDFETKGADPSLPDTHIVGVGLANEHGAVYFTDTFKDAVLQWLSDSQTPLIAHNMFFDASWVMRDWPDANLNWHRCTYALAKMMATEGWAGQSWSLASLQRELLLWEVSNKDAVAEWLVLHGFYTSTSTTEKTDYVPFQTEAGPRWGKADKAQLWQVPHEVLGPYCMLDAESTWLLYFHIFLPVLGRFPALAEFMSPARYTQYILAHIHQKLRGIRIDRPALARHRTSLEETIVRCEQSFANHPLIRPHIDSYNLFQVEEKRKREPPRYKKNGEESRNYVKWQAEVGEMLGQMQRGEHAPWMFNVNSGQQKQWLFYECLGHEVVKRTDSGQPAVDGDALRAFGEPGRLLVEQNDAVKELGYVTQMLELSEQDSRIHHGFRTPGTLTGRLSGKDPNLQQVPKSVEFLKCFVPDEGNVLVQFDFSAIEQVVLAELSKDESLWQIYGPSAPVNDIYLFNGAHMAGIGERIRASGYDPLNPTKESIAHAKKVCKPERQIAKMVSLAAAYGASAKKIQSILRLSGIIIGDVEAMDMHRSYWDLYAGVKQYQRRLEKEHRDRDGWIVNGVGRPLGVHHEYTHDILNRQCQSTGHDCLVLFLHIILEELGAAEIVADPYVLDFHDEVILEVPKDSAAEVCKLINNVCLPRLNAELGCVIPLKGDATIHRNLASIKCEDYTEIS